MGKHGTFREQRRAAMLTVEITDEKNEKKSDETDLSRFKDNFNIVLTN